MTKKRIILSITLITLLLLLIGGVTVAWFYFPLTQNVIINSDTDYSIGFNLYKLDTDTNHFVQINDSDDDNTDYVLTGNAEASFYKWGSGYYSDFAFVDYYVLELTYPDNTFNDGLGKFIITSYLSATGSMEDNDDNIQVEFMKLSYAVCSLANRDIGGSDIVTEAKASSTTYTPLTFTNNSNTLSTDTNYYKENELNIVLRDLNTSQYCYSTTVNNETVESCRVLIFLKLEDNPSNISGEVSELGLSLSSISITVANYYNISAVLRSVPYKPVPTEVNNDSDNEGE